METNHGSEVTKLLQAGLPKGHQCLYRWKKEVLTQSGPIAGSLEGRVRELEADLRRVERERDILKKALAIFGRSE